MLAVAFPLFLLEATAGVGSALDVDDAEELLVLLAADDESDQVIAGVGRRRTAATAAAEAAELRGDVGARRTEELLKLAEAARERLERGGDIHLFATTARGRIRTLRARARCRTQ